MGRRRKWLVCGVDVDKCCEKRLCWSGGLVGDGEWRENKRTRTRTARLRTARMNIEDCENEDCGSFKSILSVFILLNVYRAVSGCG